MAQLRQQVPSLAQSSADLRNGGIHLETLDRISCEEERRHAISIGAI